ncbi:MAG: TetR/AcrR family transcriptional regulator [Gemmatimonadaceae bacterium]|jgi:AcrR family transcriptional regulator|nr:TetR/AcrR family transcriptional regulator [Gemmatimonadaceae bacterium]
MVTVRTAPARGRPRRAESTDAILDAALAVLAERGYRAMTLDDVAARARASKPTMYRRWPTKVAIVAAAILHGLDRANPLAAHVRPASRDDAPAARLLRIVENVRSALVSTPLGGAIRAVISEVAHEPILADALRVVERSRRPILAGAVRALQEAGAFDARRDPDTVVDLLLGAIYFRVLVRQERPGPPFSREVVAVLLGDAVPR